MSVIVKGTFFARLIISVAQIEPTRSSDVDASPKSRLFQRNLSPATANLRNLLPPELATMMRVRLVLSHKLKNASQKLGWETRYRTLLIIGPLCQ